MNSELTKNFTDPKISLPLIIILAFTVRIIFYVGHIFSDDSYYAQLAYSYLQGNYGADFVGYPIHLLRKLITFLTLSSFSIFGKGEVSSIFFPFLFSILSIILIYFVALELTENKKVSLLSAFLLAVFPTDVIFASINFADLTAAFLINVGIYYVIQFLKTGKDKYFYFAGLYFAISIFAKMTFYYVGILIVILSFYYLIKKDKQRSMGLLVTAIIPLLLLVVEGIIIGSKTGNYFYRFQILEANYQYTYYNFFPYTILGDSYSSFEYFLGILQQVFVQNIKDIFLRRYFLLIPLFALIASVIFIRRRENKGLVFWFLGLTVLMIGFTTSPISYKPLDLKFSWYAYPIFFPSIIITALLISKYLDKIKILVLVLFFASSLYMSAQYHQFFDVPRKNELKEFVKQHPDDFIFTDHHTKYGIDLVRGYKNSGMLFSLTDKSKSLTELPNNSLIIYNQDEIDELKLQGNTFPDFRELILPEFQIVEKIGEYKIYRKVE